MSLRTTDEWLEALSGLVPAVPVYNVAQALANPFVAVAGMVRNVPHPAKPDLKLLANPLKIDGLRPEQRVCSALGADNAALLGSVQARTAAE
jgi:crotonobetainyl-CoA:carnitine CoA-transferase CaiB-like acyl-CoA transferase